VQSLTEAGLSVWLDMVWALARRKPSSLEGVR